VFGFVLPKLADYEQVLDYITQISEAEWVLLIVLAGVVLVAYILTAARGADAIATVCPMCQMNLEAFQAKASRFAGENLAISVLYLPQLLGLAIGLSESELGLGFNLALTAGLRNKLAA